MKIIIDLDDALVADPDTELALNAAICRVLKRGQPTDETGTTTHAVRLYEPRDATGFHELTIVFNADPDGRFVQRQSLLVGQIQRSAGAEFAFHS